MSELKSLVIDETLLDKERGLMSGAPNEVRVIIVSAKDLKAKDKSIMGEKSADPYTKVRLGSRIKRTEVIENTLEPEWQKKFIMTLDTDPVPSSLQIHVFDKDVVGEDDDLGSVEIALDELTTQYQAKWYPLNVGHGQIYIAAKKIRDPIKAKSSTVNSGMKPAILKWIATLLMALCFLVSFLGSVLAHTVAAILEYLVSLCLRIIIYVFTGFSLKIDFISIRPGRPTEIAISGLQLQNPNGSYKSPYCLRLDRLDIHVNLGSLFTKPTGVLTIPLVRIDGLTLYTEKAKSPLLPRGYEILNLWAFLGGSPLDEDNEELREMLAKMKESSAKCMDQCFARAKAAEERGLLPKSAMGINLQFLIDCLLITDLNLYLKDLVADLAGGDGTGETHQYKPVEIGHILMDVDDFGPKPLWVVDLVKLILPKFIARIPVSSILSSSLGAAGSTLFDKPHKAQQKVNENANKIQDTFFGFKPLPNYDGTDNADDQTSLV